MLPWRLPRNPKGNNNFEHSPVLATWRHGGTLCVDAFFKWMQKETVRELLQSHDQGIKQCGLLHRRIKSHINHNNEREWDRSKKWIMESVAGEVASSIGAS